ncbi:E3 ubiquitin-protein ligase RNF34 isoform X2 [Trichoplusia ni]|uniref:E3 ubiquitin-protein ligase RNF34 isoform X2 n=1 Tax=Trichoplusia ni TaxID=7111 RepID=A0A7E5WRC5_TRINI|nr:E3 ubiquitin-protein ligase RNF34 isoform X2 [Trichoplusia ni]
MPCESCAVQFSVFKRKRACCECERYYCSSCLRRGGGTMCAPCRVLSTRPLSRQDIAQLKVRDLQCFLKRQNVSTRGCVEKEELLNLCVSHVNSAAYRRRGSRAGSSPFSSLKGLTNNINDFINSAFDLRNNTHPAPPPPPRGYASNCFNSAHVHDTNSDTPVNSQHHAERFTTRPGGEPDIQVSVPQSSGSGSRSASADSGRVDTADCYEIEDLDDAGWEFINRPADPLPNDSEVLLSASESFPRRARLAAAASELELRAAPAPASPARSLQDEPLGAPAQGPPAPHALPADAWPADDHHLHYTTQDTPQHINLEQFGQISDLDMLNVKQLKELLIRNRVEFRGCLERKDLLERAKTLWRNHAQYKDDLDNLPIEECCKICMAAPLECVLLECGHIAACTRCSKQLAECPICRQYVVRAVRVFRS